MDQDKYYTPSIEDFHVGFKYELCINNEWYSQPDFPVMFNEDWEGVITDLIESKEIRVKYLDKEDFKSLGFKITKEREFEFDAQLDVTEFSFYDITYDEYLKELTVELFTQSKMLGVPMDKNTFDSTTVFQGIIKNKSELKQIINKLRKI